jgi:hypothetical protein
LHEAPEGTDPAHETTTATASVANAAPGRAHPFMPGSLVRLAQSRSGIRRFMEMNGRPHGLKGHAAARLVGQSGRIWFSILQRRVLRYGSFESVTALAHDVLGFIRHWNRAEVHPFRWTFAGRFVDAPDPIAA